MAVENYNVIHLKIGQNNNLPLDKFEKYSMPESCTSIKGSDILTLSCLLEFSDTSVLGDISNA